MSIDLGQVARELGLPSEKIQRTVELLDQGNTVPFITRYRKDQTGGLDEDQIRQVQEHIDKLRVLADRKATILKSIESQGKLTPDLAHQINTAQSPKRLEDLYLPYKPKKQTLATLARQRGLEPLAAELLDNPAAVSNLEARAAELVSPEKQLQTTAEVLQGVGHLLAERFSERAELRGRLRRIMWRSGKLVSTRVEGAEKFDKKTPPEASAVPPAPSEPPVAEAIARGFAASDTEASARNGALRPADVPSASPPDGGAAHVERPSAASSFEPAEEPTAEQPTAEEPTTGEPAAEEPAAEEPAESQPSGAASEHSPVDQDVPIDEPVGALYEDAADAPTAEPESSGQPIPQPTAIAAQDDSQSPLAPEEPSGAETHESPPPSASGNHAATDPNSAETQPAGESPLSKAALARRAAKQRKRQKDADAFKDYYDYQEPLSRVPPHRVLAINRGERTRELRVRIDADVEAMNREAEQLLVPEDHPHADFLRNCARDALMRLVLPALEREVRRELTERAEKHAVEVFARNLRNLLLQPPVRGRRVLAIDPGFRSGCKLIALDEFGNVLGHGVMYLIGNAERRRQGREALVAMVKQYDVSVIAIGNGTACRETEQLAADAIAKDLSGRDVAYVVVNEAGASVYSTSPLGREELPGFDAILRSAISIGRRLLDPLSELVKINPANIGVGMYQHDVKAKHLRDSLDAVVESCVNYVGVDVNTASPALLGYVSGLNQLTARRLYEFRREHGPFRNRDQFKHVPGFGDATFIQAAGFLKITGGDNPLDATWIHPESYEDATRILDKLDSNVTELARKVAAPPKEVRTESPDAQQTDLQQTDLQQADLQQADLQQADIQQADIQQAGPQPEIEQPNIDQPNIEQPGDSLSEALPGAKESATAVDAYPLAAIDTAGPHVNGEALVAADGAIQSPPSSAPADRNSTSGVSLAERAASVDVDRLAQELSIGKLLLADILASLTRPGRDPRDDLPPPVFRRGVMKLEDLKPGMELTGTVLNVVDFGAFVDIGLSDSGLVHISRLADRFIRDPHEVIGVGDVLKVWVVDVDKQRRRVSLTAIDPSAPKPARPKHEKPAGPKAKPAQYAEAKKSRRPEVSTQPTASQQPPAGRRSAPRPDSRRAKPARTQTPHRPRPKPKPVTPITKAMEEGKEPLRSFSDLKQFFEKKKKPDDQPDTNDQA